MMSPRKHSISRRTFAGGLAAAPVALALAGRTSSIRAADTTTINLNIYQISDDWHATFKKVLAGFTTAHPAIEVKLNIQPSDQYWDKLQTQYAAGQAPDVTLLNMDWVVPGAARGMFVDLKPYMVRDKVDPSAYWYPFDREWGWKGGIYGGLLYAGGQALYVNKDLLAAAKLEFPRPDWTWDDLLTYARTLTNPAKQQWGLHMANINPPTGASTSFIHGAGGTVLNEARTKCTLTEPAARQGLQFVADLILKEKVLRPPAATQGQEDPFSAGKVGMLFGGTWDEVAIRTSGVQWDFAHIPVNKETGIQSVPRDSNAWSILSTTKHKDEAWQLIKYLIGPEAQTGLMTLGIPVIKSVVDGAEFRAAHKPQDIGVVVNDFEKFGHDIYPTPDAAQWWDVCKQELSVIWTGEASVADATARAAKSIDAIFAKRPPDWN
jgi:multiple sugar transport system substrate-binding protein